MTTMQESTCLPTVLCVDDEPAVLHALDRVLRRCGCRVLLTDNGPAALELLEREQVEVMICDQAMPAMRGTELLYFAKAIAPATSRILLTGHCNDQAVVMEAVNDGGVFRLLAKPWDDEKVRQAVVESLGAEPAVWSEQRNRMQRRLETAVGRVAGGQ